MRLFKWTKLHAAFVPEIDAEHQRLFRAGDELQQAIEAGAGVARLSSIVQSIITISDEHFSHEERLMRSSHYPIYAWHKQQHDGARRRLRQFELSLAGGGEASARQMMEYLAGWLKDHTALTDRMFAAYLRNHERLQAIAS
jgi:hemerythrin